MSLKNGYLVGGGGNTSEYLQCKYELLADNQNIIAGGEFVSEAIALDNCTGQFSLQVAVTGSGVVDFDYLCSNDNVSFRRPNTAQAIIVGFTSSSGNEGDGVDFLPFAPEYCRYIKIRATETSGSDSVQITIHYLNQQQVA